MSLRFTGSILIIEDEEFLAQELQRHFLRTGWNVLLVHTLEDARREILLNPNYPSVILSDMKLPDGNSLDLLEETRNMPNVCEWIMLSGYGCIPDSVRAMRLGAFDFLTKPCDFEKMDLVIAAALRSSNLQQRVKDEACQKKGVLNVDSFVGRSPSADSLRYLLQRFSSVALSAVIINGESGVGKGLVARILHHSSQRKDFRIIEINCAAIPDSLLESELFGYEAGAFTGAKGRRKGLFEQADGGTLFLDEIGEMSLPLQAKLLRAIEDKKFRRIGGEKEITVEFQLLVATNKKLDVLIEEGKFRKDLYHRLNVMSIEVPPLRNRLEDIYDLVPKFVHDFNVSSGKFVRKIPEDVWRYMAEYSWPGNVRELRNVVERCVLLSDSETFPFEWLSFGYKKPVITVSSEDNHVTPVITISLDGSEPLDDMEARICEAAYQAMNKNISAAARLLSLTRETMRYRLKKHNIS